MQIFFVIDFRHLPLHREKSGYSHSTDDPVKAGTPGFGLHHQL